AHGPLVEELVVLEADHLDSIGLGQMDPGSNSHRSHPVVPGQLSVRSCPWANGGLSPTLIVSRSSGRTAPHHRAPVPTQSALARAGILIAAPQAEQAGAGGTRRPVGSWGFFLGRAPLAGIGPGPLVDGAESRLPVGDEVKQGFQLAGTEHLGDRG